MLTPNNFAVLSLEDARAIFDALNKLIKVQRFHKDFQKKLQETGISMELYEQLREFLEANNQYINNLRYFDPDEYTKEQI